MHIAHGWCAYSQRVHRGCSTLQTLQTFQKWKQVHMHTDGGFTEVALERWQRSPIKEAQFKAVSIQCIRGPFKGRHVPSALKWKTFRRVSTPWKKQELDFESRWKMQTLSRRAKIKPAHPGLFKELIVVSFVYSAYVVSSIFWIRSLLDAWCENGCMQVGGSRQLFKIHCEV